MKILLFAAATFLVPSLAHASCTNGNMSTVYNNALTMADGPNKMAVNRSLGMANNAYALGTIRECDFHLAEATRIQGIAAQLAAQQVQVPDYSSLLSFENFPPPQSYLINSDVQPQKRSVDKRPRVDAMCGDSECNVPAMETRYDHPFGGGGHTTDRPYSGLTKDLNRP